MNIHRDKEKFVKKANDCECKKIENRGTFCLIHGYSFSQSPDKNKNIQVSHKFQKYLDKERQENGSAAAGRRKKESDTDKS